MEKKAIVYLRVSTDDQQNSVEMQEEKCVAYCKFHGYTIESVIKDINISGSTKLFTREGGKQLKSVKGYHIITLKLDRMFRNVLDCLNCLDHFTQNKCALTFVDMGGMSLDTSSSNGRFFITMLSSFSELERNIISERTQSVLRSKKSRGEQYNGTALFGFKFEDKKLVESEDIEIVKKIIALMKEGKKKSYICKIFNFRNYKKLYAIEDREEYKKYW